MEAIELLWHYSEIVADRIDPVVLWLVTFFDDLYRVGVLPDTQVMIIIGCIFSILILTLTVSRGPARAVQSAASGSLFDTADEFADEPFVLGDEAYPDLTLTQLAEIERDMVTLKKLYRDGNIKANVYLSESKTLYDRAKALK
jgi:hypothetical protein